MNEQSREIKEALTANGPVRTPSGLGVRPDVRRWLARFAPLPRHVDTIPASECRDRLRTVDLLRGDAPQIIQAFAATAAGEADADALQTLRQAAAQLDAIESDLRRRLAAIAPGDAEGLADLGAINRDLAAVAARHELEEAVGPVAAPSGVRLDVSNGNLGAAAMMGLFSLGWLTFTTVHATLMIGGMMHAFGPAALFLLAFYAIFWAAGIAMGRNAIQMASRESVTLTGRRLLLRRTLFGATRETSYQLAPGCRARLETTAGSASANQRPARSIVLDTESGKSVRIGAGCPRERQPDVVRRLNEYLKFPGD